VTGHVDVVGDFVEARVTSASAAELSLSLAASRTVSVSGLPPSVAGTELVLPVPNALVRIFQWSTVEPEVELDDRAARVLVIDELDTPLLAIQSVDSSEVGDFRLARVGDATPCRAADGTDAEEGAILVADAGAVVRVGFPRATNFLGAPVLATATEASIKDCQDSDEACGHGQIVVRKIVALE
jgi:hypothetical protein